jgi:hypothetical protein
MIIEIDIVQQILQSAVAVGRYRGEEVYHAIEKKIKEIDSLSLLRIDITKANPLQYNFCQHAFGPLIKVLQDSKTARAIFKMHDHHKACFFRGVLKHIDKALPRNQSEKGFVESGMFTMIMLDNQKEIQYISNLSPTDNEILALINDLKSVSERTIIEQKKETQPADIIDSLRSLDKKGFIIHGNGDDQYKSVYEYFKLS